MTAGAGQPGRASGPALLAVLDQARARGFVGPGPLERQIAHSEAFVALLGGCRGLVVDLGSGGGLPGLVVALARPDLDVALVDGSTRRGAFLRESVAALGVGARVRVLVRRAEEVGRGALRGAAAAVVARGFGPPAATAECAAPLLQVGGRLIVSEPPTGESRWPAEPLESLGLRLVELVDEPFHFALLDQVALSPERFPRRTGIPVKRPLF